MDAGPLTIRRTLIALEDLHRLGYPVMLDHPGWQVLLLQLVAAGVAEHVRMDGEGKPGRLTDPHDEVS